MDTKQEVTMKATLLALSLVACGQPGASEDTELQMPGTKVDKTSAQVVLNSPELSISGLTQIGVQPQKADSIQTPDLSCAVASWMGDDGPETYRVQIFEDEDGPRARVRRAMTHDPSVIIKEGHHPAVEIHEEDGSLDIEWPGVGIYLWQANEGERIWTGYLYGLEDHTFVGDGPPPPCGGTQITCWEPGAASSFHYDPGYGTCVNAQGEEGLAYRDMIFVRETKNGECANLSWASPTDYLDAKVKLSGLNLRGADLTSLFLGQAHIQDARLEGAKLADIDLGEGSISGSIDWMTELPEGDCDRDNNEAFCAL